MERAFEFLKTHADLAFATVDAENKPKLRAFQLMKREGNTLYFATAPHKEVYQQLQLNPHAEVLVMEGNVSVRIGGIAKFDVTDEMCRAIYDENPVLSRFYADYQALAYFSLPIGKLDYFDLSTDPPTLQSFIPDK